MRRFHPQSSAERRPCTGRTAFLLNLPSAAVLRHSRAKNCVASGENGASILHLAVSLLTAFVWAAPPIASAASTAVPDPYAPLRASLLASRQELSAHLQSVELLTGMAVDLQARLDADLGSIAAPATPPNWSDAE